MKVMLVFLLCGFPLLTVAEGEDPPPPYECTTTGSFCSKVPNKDCNAIFICMPPAGGGKWTASKFECPEGENCVNGACSKEPTACSSDGKSKFKCQSLVGMYPDPLDCTTFHMCIPDPAKSGREVPDLQPAEMEDDDFSSVSKAKPDPETDRCSDGFSYNPATTYCDKPLINNRCPPNPIPKCVTFLQNGVLTSNRVLYYVCLSKALKDKKEGDDLYYPNLYMCPNGQKYQGNFKCV